MYSGDSLGETQKSTVLGVSAVMASHYSRIVRIGVHGGRTDRDVAASWGLIGFQQSSE
jgi:hypothetical protein